MTRDFFFIVNFINNYTFLVHFSFVSLELTKKPTLAKWKIVYNSDKCLKNVTVIKVINNLEKHY